MRKRWIAVILGASLLLGGCFTAENGNSTPNSSNLNNSSGATLDNGCNHVDEDNNGKCDTCTATVQFTFDFLQSTTYTVNSQIRIPNRAWTSLRPI